MILDNSNNLKIGNLYKIIATQGRTNIIGELKYISKYGVITKPELRFFVVCSDSYIKEGDDWFKTLDILQNWFILKDLGHKSKHPEFYI